MIEHLASCRCGQLQAICIGDPLRVSVCHCLDCQRRSGSAFAVQARFADADVRMTGEFDTWSTVGESGSRANFNFCPTCGATVSYKSDALPGLTAIPVGAFADPSFPPPIVSGFEERRHRWVAIVGDDMQHFN